MASGRTEAAQFDRKSSMKKDKRPYATFAVTLRSSAKIKILSDSAFRALVEMILWSREQLTDGRIPEAFAVQEWGRAALDELSTNHPDRPSLTRVAGGDYVVHDYAEHQITTASIAAARKQEISEKRAAAGRASGEARRNKRKQTLNKTPTNAQQTAKQNVDSEAVNPHLNDGFGLNKRTNANTQVEVEVEVTSGSVERASYVSEGEAAAHARASELAMSERTSLSAPVSVGASRLVAALVGDKIGHAERTILRIKASEAMGQGRSDDDVAECIRIWLGKPELGPNALLCCMSEVDKRKLVGARLAPADQKGLEWLALGRQQPNGAVE